jgi:mono/diheme cytochrome c family protein
MKKTLVILFVFVMLIACGNQDNAKLMYEVPESASETTAMSAGAEQGKQLFMMNCASCHAVKKDLVGPALAGVQDRWPNKKLLYRYIRNADQVIKEGGYAKDLWLKWNKTVMTAFPNLKDAEIKAILEYIDEKAKQ